MWCALVAAIGAGMMAPDTAFMDGNNAFAASTFGFSLVAVSFALLTCAALSPGSLLNRLRIPGAAGLALWSYAVYLVRKPVFMALRPELLSRGVDPGAPLSIAAVMAAGIVGGWVLFRVVETPFMRLRARWYPTGASKGRDTVAVAGECLNPGADSSPYCVGSPLTLH